MRTLRITILLTAWVMVSSADPAAQITRTDVKKGTWRGQLFEYSCFRGEQGIDAATPEHTACALQCLKKGGAGNFLALLTDDEGFMKIVGEHARDNYVKLHPYLGKRLEITGVSFFPMTGSYQPRELEIEKLAAID